MTSFVSAEQVIKLWRDTHRVELSQNQYTRLMSAVAIIVDGAYAVGKRDAIKELNKVKEPIPASEKTDQDRYDSVTVTGSGRLVDKEPD